MSSPAVFHLSFLLVLFFGASSVVTQDLRERDALCNGDGCFVVYFQPKTFLDAWRACKDNGGNLATIKRKEDANDIARLFSTLDLRQLRSKVQVWIGLQRHPRQCTTRRTLRGYSWTTGDQDTEYTNWLRDDPPTMCSVPRCVVMGYSLYEQNDNFKWLDESCVASVDGYLCHYAYKGMCSALRNEGAGIAHYTTPFNLKSSQLTHIPLDSVATMPCPADTKGESVQCALKEDGSVGWSREPPLCPNPTLTHSSCGQDNGGCEHFCRQVGIHFYCECDEGYQLEDNGQDCTMTSNVCQEDSCEFECLPTSDGYRCACPVGYMLLPDERGCEDVDECLQSPCEQICVNSPGSFACQCHEGYHLNDEGECDDTNECENNPCEHFCDNTPGSYKCFCDFGYSPLPEDPKHCQDNDECQIPGTCEQMCVNYEGGFDCICEEGYELRYNYKCYKVGERDDNPAITPPFPWATHGPRPAWDTIDYWNPRLIHTDWPPEEDQRLDWLTDPPRVWNPDVIWVTSAPQDELPTESSLDTTIKDTEEHEENIETIEVISQPEQEVFSDTTNATPPPTTKSITTPEWYEDDDADNDNDEDEETTTALPFLSSSTISEGAWNWWTGHTTPRQESGNPVHSSSYSEETQYPLKETPKFPGEELGQEDKDTMTITYSVIPTQPIPSQTTLSKDDNPNFVEDDSENSMTWLLVVILVPICIFIVVLVALGIVCRTRCAVQARNKNASDCYHWISGAHGKQGAPHLAAGVMTHV